MADPERLDLTQDRANTQARQFWQRAAWTRSANVTAVATDARPIADAVGGQATTEPIDWDKAEEWQMRKAEEERFAYLMETSVVFLDLPPAQSRGYAGDDQLLGRVREDDVAPDQLLYEEIVRLEPQMVFFPLAVGNHVDHQIVRDVGLNLLGQGRRWVMPGPNFVGALSFYEDFPYAVVERLRGAADRWADRPRPAGRRGHRGALRRHHRHDRPQGSRHQPVRRRGAAPVRVEAGDDRRRLRLSRAHGAGRPRLRLRREVLGDRRALG